MLIGIGIGIGIGIYSIIKYGGSKGLKNMIMVGSSREGTQVINVQKH